MFDKIITYSIQNKFVIGLLVAALIVWGIFSLRQLPIDAVPDITNNQVQVITISPTLATQEVEQFITTPVELALQNVQQLVEIRSISRFGLSVVTVVFEEDMDIYLARQLVSEYLKEAEDNIPPGIGTPEMAPISTGLGEIYQYVVRPEKGYEDQYSLSDLRTIQDWIVKRQLSGIKGVVEINTMGGYLKQYEVAVDPNLLKSMGISITDVFTALSNSNENTGGAYIEKNAHTYYIRTNGIVKSLSDIGNIVVMERDGKPILVKDVATVQFGKAPRYGALVRDGREAVGGRVMMLKGANSAAVTERVKARVSQIQKSLPEGVVIEPYLVRDKLVNTAMGTVKKNLLEGGLIVIFILILMLGNFRAGLIVASVIPLAMLFAISMMNVLGISANLMSLGALDFGLIVDGAVIIVETVVHRLHVRFAGQKLTQEQMDSEVTGSSIKIMNASSFGMIIILMVYIPILALIGIEGKMFKPMAETVMLAITGALLLSLTYVPMMTALFLSKKISTKKTIADRIINFFQKIYRPIIHLALRFKAGFVIATTLLFVISFWVFSRMGGEFIPTLEEGDLAMQQISPPGTSLSQSIEVAKVIQKKLLDEFPEIQDVVTNIGSAEIPTDPMPVEIGDGTLIMKPKSEWTSAKTRKGMFEKIENSLKDIPGVGFEFSQPIQLRFNELISGSKADVAVKLYGDNQTLLYTKAKEAEKAIKDIKGVGTVNVEQTIGMPQIIINYKYDKMAQYGLQIREVNSIVRAAFAGESAGIVYEGERRFDLIVRLGENHRNDLNSVRNLYITLDNGKQVPLQSVASVELVDAPMQISRDNTNRRIVIGVNVGDTDIETLVAQIKSQLDTKIELPAGYYFTYGGQFENLKAANERLSVAVPLALALIFILLFFTFGSIWQAVLIFTAIPLSAIGGVWALELRGMPFSISAGIGFIALFGVAVLNGIVLIGYFNQLKREGVTDIRERILKGVSVRLRPVLMTAAVASLGFLPMALSTSGGAEVQRPLATVVIGGLISATFLTLVVLPILYSWLATWQERNAPTKANFKGAMVLIPLLFIGWTAQAQRRPIPINEAIEIAIKNHPAIKAASLNVDRNQALSHLKYSPGSTDISYAGDGLFRRNGQQVNQFGLTQSFPNPAVFKAKNTYQDEMIKSSRLQKSLTENELRLNVRQLYFELQYKKELKKLYEHLIGIYAHYLEKAKVRVDVGAANSIETLTIGSSLNQYQLLDNQVGLEIHNLERQLQLLLNTSENITTTDSLIMLEFKLSANTTPLEVQLAQQQIGMEQAKLPLIRSETRPGFSVGYALQNYFEGGWLSGVEVGISLPLFNQPIRKQIAAQKLQVAIANVNYEAALLDANRQLSDIENAIQLYAKGATYYRNQLDLINPEVERISALNYHAGEISYLELLNTLDLLSNNNKNYLEQLLAFNQAVAMYWFYVNK